MDQRAQVVDGDQRPREQFLGDDEMADVGARERAAGVAIAGLVNGTAVAGEGGVHQVETSLHREGGVMTRQPRRQDAVEDVHAAGDAVDQVFGRPDAHQVARLVFGKQRGHDVEHCVHLGFGLADGESANGDSGRPEGGDELGRLRSKVRADAALDDSEEGLVGAAFGFEGTFGPAMSPLHGDAAVGVVVRVGTFVEGHDDVRAEVFLDADRTFGGEAMRRAVNVTFEGHAVVVNFARLREREDLESARVRQHGTRPLHETVQSAHFSHEVVAGAEVEMIGVAQHERGVDVLEMFGREGFDGGLCADRREDGREQVAVRGGERPRAGASIAGGEGEIEHGEDYNGNYDEG